MRVIFIFIFSQRRIGILTRSQRHFIIIHVVYICFVRVTANRTVILALGCWITALAHTRARWFVAQHAFFCSYRDRKRTISPVCVRGGKGSDDQGFIISLRRRRQRRVTANQRHEQLVNPLPINQQALLETAEWRRGFVQFDLHTHNACVKTCHLL